MATVKANLRNYFINPALYELGEDGLSSLDSTSTNLVEKMAYYTIDDIIDEVLHDADWTCITKRDSSLTQSTDHTADEFTYGYDLPSDFVHLIGRPLFAGYFGVNIYEGISKAWRIVGSRIECNTISPDILYVYRPIVVKLQETTFDDSDGSYYELYDSFLKRAVQTLCKARWADAVAGKDITRYEALYRQIIREARSKNNGNNPSVLTGTNRVKSARYRGR